MTGTLFDDEVQGHDANHARGNPSNESPENDRGEAGAGQATVPHRRLHHLAGANRNNYRK